MKNIALVTGGTGYLGKNLTRKLLDSGWEVHLLVRDATKADDQKFYLDGSTTHFYDGNINNLISILELSRPTVVFHLAAKVVTDHKFENVAIVEEIYDSNILFGSQLLEAMRICSIKKFVNTGTFWQYYEGGEYNPVSLYAASKQAFEAILKYYVNAENYEVITLTLFDNYGPLDTRPKLFSMLNKLALSNSPVEMSGGEQYINIVYIDDVAQAYITAGLILIEETGSKYNNYVVSSPSQIKLRDLVEIYLELATIKPKILWGARTYRDREVMHPWSSGVRLPGWHPQVDLRQGIAKILPILNSPIEIKNSGK